MSEAAARATIKNVRGLHARAAAKFCDVARGFEAEISVSRGALTVGGCSLMALLTLGAGKGAEVVIRADGSEASAAVEALVVLIEDGFGEAD